MNAAMVQRLNGPMVQVDKALREAHRVLQPGGR